MASDNTAPSLTTSSSDSEVPRLAASGLPELPAAPASRTHHYGAHHHIPTISQYRQTKKDNVTAADEYAAQLEELEQKKQTAKPDDSENLDHKLDPRSDKGAAGGGAPVDNTAPNQKSHGEGRSAKEKVKDAPKSQGQMDKEEMMSRMKPQGKPTDNVEKKGERRVRDPITGEEVVIKDANPKDFDPTIPRIHGSNIHLHPFPPPQSPSLTTVINHIDLLGVGIAGGLLLIWFFSAFGHGWWRFIRVSTLCGGIGAALVTMVSLASRGLEKEMERVRIDMHRQRGETFSPPMPESVEWLNSLIKLMWGLVNPTMFVGIADMVEDIMQASLPGFVDAVKISDIGQGTNPLRILSIRALADQPGDSGYPKQHWIDKGEDVKTKDTAGKELEEDQAGDYWNFEVAFAYEALPGQGDRLRSKNIHLLLEFFIGMYDWLHIPIPIWIQIESIYGVVRLRCQFIPEFPYIRNLTFSLMGVPSVDISATPLSKMLPNVLDLPFVSRFVSMAIAAGTAELCAPKSMTINLKEMLSTVVGDTHAVGVFVVTIHYAEGLSAQDSNGKSDPYIVLAYAKFGKPVYSTRIIIEDLNPVWEETAVMLLSEDEIKSQESVSCTLWDSDKRSADDLIGRIQIPVKELMEEPNKMHRREDKFSGFEDADDMPGSLTWSIGYFQKVALVKELEREPTKEEKEAAPAPAKPAAAQELSPYDKAPKPAADPIPPPPDLQKTRPDPKYPSGVLSVILHQITNLERQELDGKTGDREGEAGQDTDNSAEASGHLPSGYGEIIVNDDMVYKTRVKQYTTNPYYEAGTEVFVRDFNDTVVRVVIRDSRLREADPILGVVSVRLSEVFAQASSVTQTYAITEGVGFGKALISFAFRGMQTSFPPNLRGWSTATLAVSSVSATLDPAHSSALDIGNTKLSIHTADSSAEGSKKDCEAKGDDGLTMEWGLEGVRLPVYARYQSSVVFELGGAGKLVSLLPGKGGPDAIAVLWLQDLTDDIEQHVKIPILIGDNLTRLRQQAINDQTASHHNFTIIGYLSATLLLHSGLDADHESLAAGASQARRHAYQAYFQVEGAAEVAEKNSHAADDGVVDKEERKAIEKAHTQALESRGRGKMQIRPYRTAMWMKDGVKSRLTPKSTKSREPAVQSEA